MSQSISSEQDHLLNGYNSGGGGIDVDLDDSSSSGELEAGPESDPTLMIVKRVSPKPIRNLHQAISTMERMADQSQSEQPQQARMPAQPLINSAAMASAAALPHIDIEIGVSDDDMRGKIRTCRICFETEDESDDELLNPCRCAGTSQWVHRTCLNEWRAHNEEAFIKCFECLYRYRTTQSFHQKPSCCGRINLYLARHGIQFYCLNQIVIFVIALAGRWLDNSHYLLQLFQMMGLAEIQADKEPELLDFNFFYYYLVATVLFLGFWLMLFLGNLLCGIRRNRCLYLRGFIKMNWGTLFCLCILTIVPFVINIFLGTFFLSLTIQLFLRNHYSIVESLYRAEQSEILPYDPDMDIIQEIRVTE